jgi:hypothetical protein
VRSTANSTEAIPQEEALAAAVQNDHVDRLTPLHALALQNDLEALRQAAFDPTRRRS